MKRIPKKAKRLKENAPLQVTMTPQSAVPTSPGKPPTGQTTVAVSATNPEQALQQATAQMPGKKFSQIAIGPKPQTGIGPSSAVQPNPVQPPITAESIGVDQYRYPYGIVVPKQFEALIRKAVVANDKTLAGIDLSESYGRIAVQVNSPAGMALFVARLGRSRDAMARTILEGIRDSK